MELHAVSVLLLCVMVLYSRLESKYFGIDFRLAISAHKKNKFQKKQKTA